jgi:hypothetical protein
MRNLIAAIVLLAACHDSNLAGAPAHADAPARAPPAGDPDLATPLRFWTARSSGVTSELGRVAYGLAYVAVGESGALLSSDDGITWTSRPVTGQSLHSVAATNSSPFLGVVGATGTSAISDDGVAWSPHAISGSATYTALTRAAPGLVALSGSGTTATTLDGVSWTVRQLGRTLDDMRAVAHGAGGYIAVANDTSTHNGFILTTTDPTSGNPWAQQRLNGSELYDITSPLGTEYVLVGRFGEVERSFDGTNWSSSAPGTQYDFYTGTRCSGLYLVGGTDQQTQGGVILSSSDFTSWTVEWRGSSRVLGIACGFDKTVAVGEAGLILTRP